VLRGTKVAAALEYTVTLPARLGALPFRLNPMTLQSQETAHPESKL
jgi:hypothetical protein